MNYREEVYLILNKINSKGGYSTDTINKNASSDFVRQAVYGVNVCARRDDLTAAPIRPGPHGGAGDVQQDPSADKSKGEIHAAEPSARRHNW